MVLSTILRPRSLLTQPNRAIDDFSLNPEIIGTILRDAKPLGHHEARDNLNLGFGFMYYAMVRALRPEHVVVIGSGFGFSVVCFALALKDNAKGRLSFVDPSYSVFSDGPFKTVGGTAQWNDPERVTQHFARFGVDRLITHYCVRSDEFFAGYGDLRLPEIDLAFIDGSHAYDDVRKDFVSTLRNARRNTYILLHDTNIYVRELMHHAGVKRWLNTVRHEREFFEVVDFPFSSGVAIVRVLKGDAWKCLEPVSPR
jgi:predicted O-methyltransferase YrrM